MQDNDRYTSEAEITGATYQRSQEIGELAAALALTQVSLRNPTKDQKAQIESQRSTVKYSYTYADLASVLDVSRDLAKNGVAVIQPTSNINSTVTVTTMLVHKTGQWISCDLTMTATQNTPQAIGSAITYARRYGLQTMVGIAGEDDDGAEASKRPHFRDASDSRMRPRYGDDNGAEAPKRPPITTGAKPKISPRAAFVELRQRFGERLPQYQASLDSLGIADPAESTDDALALVDKSTLTEAYRNLYSLLVASQKVDGNAAGSDGSPEPPPEFHATDDVLPDLLQGPAYTPPGSGNPVSEARSLNVSDLSAEEWLEVFNALKGKFQGNRARVNDYILRWDGDKPSLLEHIRQLGRAA